MNRFNQWSQWTLLKIIFVIGLVNDGLLIIVERLQAIDEATVEVEAEALLKTFPNIGDNILPDVVRTALVMSQAMDSDLNGVAIQLGKALADPSNCFPILKRAWVLFAEEQKQQIKSLADAGQVAEAQAVILAELNKEYGVEFGVAVRLR